MSPRTNPNAQMSVMEHVRELRKRFGLVLIGVLIGSIAGWFLFEPVMDFIMEPLKEIEGGSTELNFPTIGGALDLHLRVSIWIGLIVSSPWWVYQVGAFIMPGLKRRERIYALAFGAAGVVLFLAGATMGVFIAPRAVRILQSFVLDDAVALLQADMYVDFYLRLVILFGVSFFAPLVLVALNFLGVMSSRTMLKGWRWAVMIATLFAAISNPLPSPWPMIAQALVLVSLYFAAVLIAFINERYRTYGRRLRPEKKSISQPREGASMHSVESPERESPQCELLGAIVLAGGTARRMGGVSKPDVEVGGKSLLIRAVEEIRASAPDAHIVVVAPPGVRIPDGVTRVLEDPPLGGPAAGVAAGWHVLATRGPYDPEAHVALLTCDAPLAPRLYPQLDAVLTVAVSAPATDDVATGGTVPVIEDDSGEPHSQYLHGVYVAAALDQLLSGDVRERSVRSLFRQLSVLEVPDQERWGIDVDTWDDVHALEARLAD